MVPVSRRGCAASSSSLSPRQRPAGLAWDSTSPAKCAKRTTPSSITWTRRRVRVSGFSAGQPMTKTQVLVVDDEADIRELLTMTLSRMGLETHCAGTQSEALALLGQNTYELCL